MKNENIDVDMLLRSALRGTETPDPGLVRKVKYGLVNEKENTVLMKSNVKRSFRTLAVAVLAVALVTGGVFAASRILNSAEVADKFEDVTLRAAFSGESAVNINASVTSGDYIFTLPALVSGKDLSDYARSGDGELLDDRSYAVMAIQRADGGPMPAGDDGYGNPPFYVSPYVKGQKPWLVNAHTLNGAYAETVVDGVMYRIFDCDSVAAFADRGVYLGVHTGMFYDGEAFLYDEATGALSANPDYDGSSAVFDLPLDKSLADPEKAQRILADIIPEPGADEAGAAGAAETGETPSADDSEAGGTLSPSSAAVLGLSPPSLVPMPE
jgi:hypothetical protein